MFGIFWGTWVIAITVFGARQEPEGGEVRMRKVSRSRKEIHLTVLVDGTKEDFETMAKKIREMAVVGNHFSDRKMSYDIIWVPLLRSRKGTCPDDCITPRYLSDQWRFSNGHRREEM